LAAERNGMDTTRIRAVFQGVRIEKHEILCIVSPIMFLDAKALAVSQWIGAPPFGLALTVVKED
jgi:hypothetical protein